MPTSPLQQKKLLDLHQQFLLLSQGRENLLQLINEAEISESVYNSNAIENSTLTLKETERILLEMEVSSHLNLREVFEAKNLARVMEYIRQKSKANELTFDLMRLLHQMLLGNIDQAMAGHFRQPGEYVKVGNHIAPPPEQLDRMLGHALFNYQSNHTHFIVDRMAHFHLEFEHIHPFLDGNGRMGRVLLNFQMIQAGFPTIILRNKEKRHYYQALRDYDQHQKTEKLERMIYVALMESLHKRVTYLKGESIIKLTDYARQIQKSPSTLLNAAKRQTIPAFREREVWKIGVDSKACSS